MERQLPPFVWLLTVVIPLLLGRLEKRQTGLGLVSGVSKLNNAINFWPKGGKFTLREDYMPAIGKDRMGRHALALR
jgi:hypothetical protein